MLVFALRSASYFVMFLSHLCRMRILKLNFLALPCYSIEHPSSFIFEKTRFSSIGDSAFNGNTFVNGSVRANSALHSSLKSTNKRKKKRKPKTSPKSASDVGENKPLGRSLSEDELCTHLNSKVNYGKRGPSGPRARNRGIAEADSDINSEYFSDRQRDQQFFLRQLNNRPTLVLNANYLVS